MIWYAFWNASNIMFSDCILRQTLNSSMSTFSMLSFHVSRQASTIAALKRQLQKSALFQRSVHFSSAAESQTQRSSLRASITRSPLIEIRALIEIQKTNPPFVFELLVVYFVRCDRHSGNSVRVHFGMTVDVFVCLNEELPFLHTRPSFSK